MPDFIEQLRAWMAAQPPGDFILSSPDGRRLVLTVPTPPAFPPFQPAAHHDDGLSPKQRDLLNAAPGPDQEPISRKALIARAGYSTKDKNAYKLIADLLRMGHLEATSALRNAPVRRARGQ